LNLSVYALRFVPICILHFFVSEGYIFHLSRWY